MWQDGEFFKHGNLHIFQLNNMVYPKFLKKARHMRMFAYILGEKPDGSLDTIYEIIFAPESPTFKSYKYIRANTNDFQEKELTQAEFLALKPEGQNPGIWDIRLFTKWGKIYSICVLEEFHMMFGMTFASKWPRRWAFMNPVEIFDFSERCNKMMLESLHSKRNYD